MNVMDSDDPTIGHHVGAWDWNKGQANELFTMKHIPPPCANAIADDSVRLGDMIRRYVITVLQIGNRSRDAQHAMIAARRQLERLHRRAEHVTRLLGDLTVRESPPPRRMGSQGGRVRNERLRRGWSRKNLAAQARVDEATIRRIEEDTSRLALRPLRQVLGALGMDR
jgi:hypothetical protein